MARTNKPNPNRTEPTYYGNMPAEVRYCKELSASEKVLYCEFAALSSKTGYAWAANSYFAELYDVEPTTVSEWINNLSRYGFIKIYNPKGRARKIALTNILRKKIKAIDKPKVIAEPQPSETPETNNTSINTKTNNIVPPLVPEEDFNFKTYLEGSLANSKGVNNARFFAVYYIKRKGLVFKDKRSFEAVVRQWVWAGKILGEFVGDIPKVEEAFRRAENKERFGQRVDWDLKDVINEIRKI